jgi:hypothetical protein
LKLCLCTQINNNFILYTDLKKAKNSYNENRKK